MAWPMTVDAATCTANPITEPRASDATHHVDLHGAAPGAAARLAAVAKLVAAARWPPADESAAPSA